MISDIKSPYIITAWWASFIATGFIDRYIFYKNNNIDGLETLLSATKYYIFSELLWIPATIIAILMVKKVTALQTKAMDIKNTQYYSTSAN